MKKTTKYALIVFGANVVLFLLLLAYASYGKNAEEGLMFLLFFPVFILFCELVAGIAYAVGEKNKEIGSGLLIGLGITLLIGLSVCGVMIGMS